jgi:hypothetical protein
MYVTARWNQTGPALRGNSLVQSKTPKTTANPP